MIVQLLVNKPKAVELYCDNAVPVIFMQDGVYSAFNLVQLYPQNDFYALEKDWQASGLPINKNIVLISDVDWVNICASQHPVLTIQG